VCIAVIAFFTGYANIKTEDLPDGTKLINGNELSGKGIQIASRLLEENDTYTVEMVTYQYKNAYIEYPQIQGLKDKKREEKINSLIENYLLLIVMDRTLPYPDDSNAWDQFDMQLECRVTLQTWKLLSFYYVGESMWYESNRPLVKFYSMTLDLVNTKELQLSDFVDIDRALVGRIRGATDFLDLWHGKTPDSDIIQKRPMETYIERLSEGLPGFTPSGVYSFESRGAPGFVLEPDALVIEIAGAAYKDGDEVCIQVRLPGRIVGDRFVFDDP